jgi:hypothetical protein
MVAYSISATRAARRPPALSQPLTRTPHIAILVHALGAVLLVALLRDFDRLTTYFIVVEWGALLFAVGAVIVLRRRWPDAPRPFRTPGYPGTPLVFILGTGVGLVAIVAGEIDRRCRTTRRCGACSSRPPGSRSTRRGGGWRRRHPCPPNCLTKPCP